MEELIEILVVPIVTAVVEFAVFRLLERFTGNASVAAG